VRMEVKVKLWCFSFTRQLEYVLFGLKGW
jgi:hypothetical protein